MYVWSYLTLLRCLLADPIPSPLSTRPVLGLHRSSCIMGNNCTFKTTNAETEVSSGRSDVEQGLARSTQTHPGAPGETEQPDAIAATETREINILRVITLLLLVTIAALASFGVYFYTAAYEKEKFEDAFTANAIHIIDSFHSAVERRLGAINSMADSITSHALSSGEQFPRVTLPHFEVRGSNVRVQADALIVHWMPLVTDDTRAEWEEYALSERFQIDDAFDEDARLRNKQDEDFGFSAISGGRGLQQSQNTLTVLDDGTGYHSKIWSNGSVGPRGDEPEGTGPFLPLWQRR